MALRQNRPAATTTRASASQVAEPTAKLRIVRRDWSDAGAFLFIFLDGLVWYAPADTAVKARDTVRCLWSAETLRVTRPDGVTETWTRWVVR